MDFCDIKTAVTKNPNTGSYSIKNWRLTVILALILTLTPGLTLLAAPKSKQDSKQERWFEIELIVFAHRNGQALDSEKWPEITDLVLPKKMVELSQPAPEPPEEDKPIEDVPTLVFEPVFKAGTSPTDTAIPEPIPMPVAFIMLKDEELQLNDTLKKLKRSPKFKPLLHVAWRQPTYDKKHAQAVLLYEGMTEPEFVAIDNTKLEGSGAKTGANTAAPVDAKKTNKDDATDDATIEPINPRFAGTIRLSVARYLHLAADLVYRTPVIQHVATPMQALELWNDRPYPTLSDPQGPAYQVESWKAMRGFRLKESRRMRSKKVHYLDHPFLGIVALITPVELPKDPEELSADKP